MRRLRRRNFLIRNCQAALAALLRGFTTPFLRRLHAQSAPLVDAAFHLHPQYRSQTPLDATLLKIKPGFDDFVAEKYQERIAAILQEWSEGLRQSPRNIEAIRKRFAPVFAGSSLKPVESRIVRPGAALEVRNHGTYAFAADRISHADLQTLLAPR